MTSVTSVTSMTSEATTAPVAKPVTLDLAHFFDSDTAFFSITGNDGYFKRSNPAFEKMLGWSESELKGKSFYELIHPDDIPLTLARLVEVERTGHDVTFDTRFMHKDGRYRWLSWVVQGQPLSESWYATARDITEQRELRDSLDDVHERLRLAMSISESGSWEYDLAADHVTLDSSAETVLDLAPGDFPGRLAGFLASVPAQDQERLEGFKTALSDSRPVDGDFCIHTTDGATRYVAVRGRVVETDRRGRPLRAVGVLWNVTSQKQMEQQLLDLVMNDQLTGLKNRRSFDQAVRTEWRKLRGGTVPIAVLMLDIDDFKQVNDTYGHQVGDRYLASVGRALGATATRPGDVVARYGGEEFVVLLPDCGDEQARAVGERCLLAVRALQLAHPDGHRTLSVSVGASSVLPSAAVSSAELIRAADTALYRAKADGKDSSCYLAVGEVPVPAPPPPGDLPSRNDAQDHG